MHGQNVFYVLILKKIRLNFTSDVCDTTVGLRNKQCNKTRCGQGYYGIRPWVNEIILRRTFFNVRLFGIIVMRYFNFTLKRVFLHNCNNVSDIYYLMLIKHWITH